MQNSNSNGYNNGDAPPPAQQEGEQGAGYAASLLDMIMQPQGRGDSSIAHELLSYSDNELEFWSRSVLTRQELKRKLRILAKRNIVFSGSSMGDALNITDLAGRLSINGLAREQVVQIMGGGGIGQKMRQAVERFRTPDGREVQQRQS